jgi:Mrp family chromosome partitioning ATPase
VFDCPSITIVPDAAVLLPAVDCAALVLSLGVTAKKQLAQAKAEVSKYADKYAGIIGNRVGMRQYARAFPRYDYFEEDELRKTHRRFLRKAK